jgi:hypothetical protein
MGVVCNECRTPSCMVSEARVVGEFSGSLPSGARQLIAYGITAR